MSDITPDPEVQEALNQLPDPPAHGAGFWDQLTTSVSAQSGASATAHRPFGRYAAFAAAAAAVIVVGAIGIGALGDDGDRNVLVANSTTTVPDAIPTTATPPTATTAPPASSTRFPLRAASELFHYDVGIPVGFSLDYANGHGVSISRVSQTSDATLQLSNYLPSGVGVEGFIEPYGDEETAVGNRSLTIPLYENNDGEVTDRGVILEIDEYTFTGGFSENRIVRVYVFSDRTVVAELTYRNDVLDADPLDIMDDIRMFNAALALPTQCSTFAMPNIVAPSQLNPDQRATFQMISQALTTCDWDALERLTPDEFLASFGGGDPIEIWQSAENFASPILGRLYDHLTLVPAIGSEGRAVFPRASIEFWEDVTDEMKDELRNIGYTDADFESFTEIGYTGYRTGIEADGTWTYFVAGD